ncbi:DUF2076 domain-containing protein [Methylocapsa aurea]|uniref:DUF2076 domain-containing protein n=1 Tax=Methylocapsa aurea TaxID=663610 RepID=UPI00055EFDCB|nr:DUF2076 domain-containing protein [Methylocapsa aurea]
MSPEERQLLTDLFDRIRGAGGNPRDQEAEVFIADATRALPYAPYLLAQTVIVQDQALRAANDRLQELESKVRDLEQQAASQPRTGGFLGGLGSLFGGAAPPRGAPPAGNRWEQQPPQSGWREPQQGYGQSYAPPPQPGPWGGQAPGQGFGQGGGFLKGALGAAAGVAGGVLLADSIRGLFGGHNNSLGIGTGFTGGGLGSGLGGGLGDTTTINNYYGSDDPSLRAQDARQDADQDQDDIQDAADYSDYGSDDDNTDI